MWSICAWRIDVPSLPYQNPKLLHVNDWSGFMGDDLPRVHYTIKAQLEALGARVDAARVPVWK